MFITVTKHKVGPLDKLLIKKAATVFCHYFSLWYLIILESITCQCRLCVPKYDSKFHFCVHFMQVKGVQKKSTTEQVESLIFHLTTIWISNSKSAWEITIAKEKLKQKFHLPHIIFNSKYQNVSDETNIVWKEYLKQNFTWLAWDLQQQWNNHYEGETETITKAR